MSEEQTAPEMDTDEPEANAESQAETEGVTEENEDVGQEPEFQELNPNKPSTPGKGAEIKRFAGVQVTLNAELGRTELTIQDLMSLHEGSVVELNRAINEPVELVAQGVPLGNGEVVVIDDKFAVRVKEVYNT